MELLLENNILLLLPQKAVWWKDRQTLLLSDLHIGKIAHFRSEGIALPRQAIEKNFEQLTHLMETWLPKDVIFIGDLFHSRINEEWDIFCRWREQYADTQMQIVLGNHDRLPLKMYDCANLLVHREEINIGPFTLAHHPKTEFREGEYVLSGHIHPVIFLQGMARQALKFPCFHFAKQQAVFPSFGYFTGGHPIQPEEEDTIVAIVNDKLIRVQ